MNDNKKYLHEQVYDDLKSKIENREYKYGSKIPKELDLMNIYQVSRHTIRKAMDKLMNEGYIYKVKGTGTFVKAVKSNYRLSNLSSFTELMDNQKGKPNSIVIEASYSKANDKIVSKLALDASKKCYYIERIRRNGKTNLCFERTYINPKICPDIIDFVTPNTSLFHLYENKYKLNISEGQYNLEAIEAPDDISKTLDIPPGSAVLYMEAYITLLDSTPLYFVEAYYIGSRYIFSTTLNRN